MCGPLLRMQLRQRMLQRQHHRPHQHLMRQRVMRSQSMRCRATALLLVRLLCSAQQAVACLAQTACQLAAGSLRSRRKAHRRCARTARLCSSRQWPRRSRSLCPQQAIHKPSRLYRNRHRHRHQQQRQGRSRRRSSHVSALRRRPVRLSRRGQALCVHITKRRCSSRLGRTQAWHRHSRVASITLCLR